ncbi:MAG TPA: protein phosphatase 2C domain-containing protein [Steroidobacteraceae bacterium]|jgi:serine/threonine protein phosphatase PrpC|nr:protein phosphatase 2C domain-containing protein [Steroidobacteraceae bacterium]
MSISGEVATAAFTWRSASVTSQGNVRTHNEDAVLELPAAGLWAVADGMGGHAAGDVASRMIVEALCGVTRRERPSELLDDVEDRLCAVNSQLYRTAAAGKGGMCGSTVAVLLAFGGYCLSVWAGDSRIYRSRAGLLSCITRDHTEVQALLDEGVLDAAAAGQHGSQNVITRAVGGAQDLYLDLELRELQHRDRYLLCSDGLYKELADERLAAHLAANDPEGACRALLKEALGGVCSDNVSVAVVQFSQP